MNFKAEPIPIKSGLLTAQLSTRKPIHIITISAIMGLYMNRWEKLQPYIISILILTLVVYLAIVIGIFVRGRYLGVPAREVVQPREGSIQSPDSELPPEAEAAPETQQLPD